MNTPLKTIKIINKYVTKTVALTFMVPDVPGTDATRLFEVRGEEIVDNGLVFGQGGRVVGGPRRRSRAVVGEQKRQQQQPDGGGGRRPLFAHFHRCGGGPMSLSRTGPCDSML